MSSPSQAHPFALITAIAGANSCAAFSGWTVPLQIAELTSRLGWSAPHAGSVFSATFLFVGITIVSATPFIARVPIKMFALLGTLCATLGFSIASVFPESPLYCAAGLLISGAGQGLSAVGMSALAAATPSPGRFFGISATLGILYSAAWFVILPTFPLAWPGGNALFSGCALATGLSFLAVLLAPVKSQPRRIAADAGASPTSRRVQLDLNGLAFLASNFVLITGAATIWTFAEPIGARLNLSMSDTGVILAMATVASMAAPLGIIWLDRSRNLSAYVAVAAGVTAFTLFLSCVTGSQFIYAAAMIGQSFGQVYFVSLVYLLCIRKDPTGRLAALSRSATIFGASAGPVLGAVLIDISFLALALNALALSLFGWALAAFASRSLQLTTRH